MRHTLMAFAIIAALLVAYYLRTYYYALNPPGDVAMMIERACAFDDAQSIGLRAKGGDYGRLSCPEARRVDPATVTDAEGVVARGRPFVLETVVVCIYRAPVGIPRPIRCDTFTDGL